MKTIDTTPKMPLGRALGTEAFLALVHRKAGVHKGLRDLPRAERRRRAIRDED